MPERIYKGFSTHDPVRACEFYKKITGNEPTVIVVRPNYPLSQEHPLVVRTRFASANMMLVSHLMKKSEFPEDQENITFETYVLKETESHNGKGQDNQRVVSYANRHEAICPHCGGQIKHFENLGFWYGWALGNEPPYWNELREYVFERDGFTCQKCHKVFKKDKLTCHHIQPKEEGGVDGARNLLTLCFQCHEDTHPIMPEED